MEPKSLGTAYLLWLCLGWFGVHRLYLGDTFGFAFYMIAWLLFWTGFGLLGVLIMWLVDACLLPSMVAAYNRVVTGDVVVIAPVRIVTEPHHIPSAPVAASSV